MGESMQGASGEGKAAMARVILVPPHVDDPEIEAAIELLVQSVRGRGLTGGSVTRLRTDGISNAAARSMPCSAKTLGATRRSPWRGGVRCSGTRRWCVAGSVVPVSAGTAI